MNSKPMFSLQRLITISRPRFWIYVFGPFLIGLIASGDPRFFNLEVVITLFILAIFFSFPANLLIYGINDIYDYETDKHNPKKQEYEKLVLPQEQPALKKIIIVMSLLGIIPMFWLNTYAIAALLLFIFVSLFYSALPIRAKARPPFDIIFSSLIYISPSVVAFFATGNQDISWPAVLGGLLWACAMQTYSAVPDIDADRQGGVNTLATVLGARTSLWFCCAAYLVSGIIGYLHLGVPVLLLTLVYLYMVGMTLKTPQSVFQWYKKFPVVNTILGMTLFFLIVLKYISF
jgi:4-hydroxybenzoate polyprenyltransferase